MGNWMEDAEEVEAPEAKSGGWMDDAEEVSAPAGVGGVEFEPLRPAPAAPDNYEASRKRIMDASMPEASGRAGTALGHGVQGSLKGWADELAGKAYEHGNRWRNALNGLSLRETEERRPADYKTGRDVTRERLARDEKAHPTVALAAGVGGDVATDYIANAVTGGLASTAPGAAVLGGAFGLGHSEAEDAPGMALDASLGAGLGFGAGKLGNKMSKAVENSAVAKYLGEKLKTAYADKAQQVAERVLSALKSGGSTKGGEVSAGRNAISVIDEILENPAVSAERKARAKLLRESQGATELLNKVYDEAMEQFPQRLGRINTAEAALDPLRKAATPEAIEAATDEAMSRTGQPFKDFLWNYGTRMVPVAVGSWAGNNAGDLFGSRGVGTGVGAVIGSGLGAAMGNPGTALRNLTRNPVARAGAWKAVQKALVGAPETLGRYGPVLVRAAQLHGPAAAKAIHDALMAKDEEYSSQFDAEPLPEPVEP